MENKPTFYSFFKKGRHSYWEIPEQDLAPKIFDYLSSDELLALFDMKVFKVENKKDRQNIGKIFRQALIALTSRYRTRGDLLNQRRAFLMCPQGIFEQYANELDVLNRSLYGSVQHVFGDYPYKIQALSYLAAINGEPSNLNFQADVEALLGRMQRTYNIDYSVEVELLLPFFTTEQIKRLKQICFNRSHPLTFAVQYYKTNDQETVVSLNTQKHGLYPQSVDEETCEKYLNILSKYTLSDEEFYPNIEQLDHIKYHLDNKSVSNALEKFVLDSSVETRRAALEHLFEALQGKDAWYHISFMELYLIARLGRENPDLIEAIYEFAMARIMVKPSDVIDQENGEDLEGDASPERYMSPEDRLQFGLAVLEGIAPLLTREQVQKSCDLIRVIFSPPSTPLQLISAFITSWYETLLTAAGANAQVEEPQLPDLATYMLSYKFFAAVMDKISDREVNELVNHMFTMFDPKNQAWLKLILTSCTESTKALFTKVSDVSDATKVNKFFNKIKHELYSDRVLNKFLVLHIASSFKEKLSSENLEYTLAGIKGVLCTSNVTDIYEGDFAILDTLTVIMPLLAKHNLLNDELFLLLFKQYEKVETIEFSVSFSKGKLYEKFSQVFFLMNQYTENVNTALLPKYLELLNSETTESFQRIMALESLLQLMLERKVKHVEVASDASVASKVAENIFPLAERVCELVPEQGTTDSLQSTPRGLI